MDLSKAVWAGEDWKEQLDRLKELQGLPKDVKTNLEQQEEYVLTTHLHPVPCPLCETLVGAKENEITCPICAISLRRVVPFVKVTEPGWHWEIGDTDRKELLRLWEEKHD